MTDPVACHPRTTIASSDYLIPTIIPWKAVFNDLEQHGCSPGLLHQLLDRPWSSIQRWVYRGVEPKESIGRAILVLHTRYCGEPMTKQRMEEADPIE
jgi:hypothetical protein